MFNISSSLQLMVRVSIRLSTSLTILASFFNSSRLIRLFSVYSFQRMFPNSYLVRSNVKFPARISTAFSFIALNMVEESKR